MSRFRRRRFDECIALCDELLSSNNRDQAAWSLKCQSLTKKNFIDDLEVCEESLGDLLLDENTVTDGARPGTSFQKPQTGRLGTANPVDNAHADHAACH